LSSSLQQGQADENICDRIHENEDRTVPPSHRANHTSGQGVTRLSLAELCAAMVAQSLLAEGASVVQRCPTFASSLTPLKALVVQRLARSSTRDALSRQLVLDALLTILITRSLSPDLLKRPESPRQMLLPLWHLPRAGRGRTWGRSVHDWGLVDGRGDGCMWMARTPGSLATLASVLVLGELVEMSVLTGREDGARDLLPLLLTRVVRHPLGLQVRFPCAW
jgi:hypothetical protein